VYKVNAFTHDAMNKHLTGFIHLLENFSKKSNLVPTNILEPFLILFVVVIAVSLKKGLITCHFSKKCFHFQNVFWNELSFSKCDSFSEGVFIFKM
jgi:hypothetical protein